MHEASHHHSKHSLIIIHAGGNCHTLLVGLGRHLANFTAAWHASDYRSYRSVPVWGRKVSLCWFWKTCRVVSDLGIVTPALTLGSIRSSATQTVGIVLLFWTRDHLPFMTVRPFVWLKGCKWHQADIDLPTTTLGIAWSLPMLGGTATPF